ncbi:hypothetical protein INR49_005467 [Caranx melampygus]|nr:hypothetical protein INR49_005467 [Caranx melampygus]
MSEDKEAQEDELLALASIYDEEEFRRAESAQGGEIQLCLELLLTSGSLSKIIHQHHHPSSPSAPNGDQSTAELSVPTAGRAVGENQGCVILFTWIQFLKEEALDFLGIQSPLEVIRGGSKAGGERRKTDPADTVWSHCEKAEEKKSDKAKKEKSETQSSSSSSPSQLDPRAVLLMDPRADLLPQLLDFDEAQRQRAFDAKVFCCGICFVEKLGSCCLCFKECQHVYCKACMTEYFQIQIRDGNVQCLNCPEPKCTSLATPLQVKQLVDEELFARYDRLLLQSTLDLMADVVYCPRQSCGTAVMVEPDTTMGICSACQYAFCTLCKLGYHGVSNCKIPAEELRTLRDEYLSATDEGKKFMEQRFGKRVIQKAVEESFSRDWLNENCKSCPAKVDGCNKMTCTSCKQYFCWLCLGLLSRVNPYSHFNNPHSPCYNQLFHGVDLDEEDAFWSDEED